jgi:hypothetical protein
MNSWQPQATLLPRILLPVASTSTRLPVREASPALQSSHAICPRHEQASYELSEAAPLQAKRVALNM